MSRQTSFHISTVRSPDDLAATIVLFTAYAHSLGIDLSFQDFSTEMSSMPGKYAPPRGELLLARSTLDTSPIGCVGLRPLTSEGCCEMKRLYIPPEGRGVGMGKALVDAITEVAVRLGYQEMRLDTLPKMTEAISLYRKNGFVDIEPYYDTPIPGTIFLARDLRKGGDGND